MKILLKSFVLIVITFSMFYSCGDSVHDKNERIKEDSVLTNLSASSTIIANVNIMEVGIGFMWNFGQTECTVYGKINSVLKGDIKTGDTIAFKLINENALDKNKEDSLKVKENKSYILFLSETYGKGQFGEEQVDSSKSNAVSLPADSIKFSTQKWFPVYHLTDNLLGIREYNSSLEKHLKEIIRQ